MHRLAEKADFERLLALRSCARSAHFALHHVAGVPTAVRERAEQVQEAELSTMAALDCPHTVDESSAGHWLGCVVPKKHARRAVTRNLLKRQARAVFEIHAGRLPDGLWLLRLRAPFSPAVFVSARSAALAAAARLELDGLLQKAWHQP